MSLPNDSRSPARQQRTVEIYNDDNTTIPAHGVVEIIGGGTYTNDNRVIYQVRRPTIDGSPNVIINGLVSLLPGASSEVATNDYPAWALYDTADQPIVGQMWGPIKDSYKLGYGRQGFIVSQDHAVTGGREVVRVNRHERLFRVICEDAFHPGSTEICLIQRWDGSDWIDTATETYVQDPFFRTFALPNEPFFVENYGLEWFALGEQGLRREGLVISGGNGVYLIAIYASAPSQSCTGSDSGVVVSACYNGCTELNAGDRVWVHYHPEFRSWKCIPLCVNGLIRFEMLTALPLGGQGTAIEIGTGPAFLRIGSSFPIKDPHLNPGSWRFDPKTAVSMTNRGYMGWCVIPANPQIVNGVPCREIVYMEQIARSIEFVLNSDMSSNGFAIATVTNYYIGKNPAQTNLMTGTRLLVYDSQLNYPRALDGAKGKARYNDRNHRYEVIECDQMAFLLMSSLEQMCPGDSSGGVASYNPMTFAPFSQRPTNLSSAQNVHKLSNRAGKAGTLAWNESDEEWVVLQVEHEAQYVVVDSVLAQDDCAIASTVSQLYMSVMFCDDVEESVTGVSFTEEEYVSGVTLEHTQGTSGSGSLPPSAGDCRFAIEKKTLCALVPAAPQTTYDYIDMTPSLVLSDVYTSGNSIWGTVAIVYSPCRDPDDEVLLIEGTVCDSGSS